MSKRERPPNFFDDEEDEDYMIAACLENDKENEDIGFDDYMKSKPIIAKTGNDKIQTHVFYLLTLNVAATGLSMMPDSLDQYDYDFPIFDDETDAFFTPKEITKPVSVFNNPNPAQTTIVTAMDYMDISDHEYEEEEVTDISNTRVNLDNYSRSLGTKPSTSSVKKGVNYTLIPETGAFITATCPNTGKNIYFSKTSEGESRKKTNLLVKNLTTSKGGTRGLLEKPIWQLLRDIEKNNENKFRQLQK